jgi:energy-coupling factor transporter ATP-binding protein EcfA2
VFRFPPGESIEQLVAKLKARNWRGAIIGPHGSGKSTLLETLKPALTATGRHVHAVSLHDVQRRLPEDIWCFLREISPSFSSLLIVDGYEQLGFIERLRLSWQCGLAEVGLLITSHAPTRIPTLIELNPSLQLIEQLVAELTAKVSSDITRADVAASHACHGSNVREIFFDLYDCHETSRRAPNSLPAAS